MTQARKLTYVILFFCLINNFMIAKKGGGEGVTNFYRIGSSWISTLALTLRCHLVIKMEIFHNCQHVCTLVWDLRLFVRLQTFLLLFHICLKPSLFCTSHHKPLASPLEFKNFDSLLQKFSVTSYKNGKSACIQLAPPVPGQAYGLR